MRVPEATFRLLHCIEAKPAMSIIETNESLQFRSQALVFPRTSSSNKPFNVKEEVGYNFKKTSRKTNKKFTAKKMQKFCTRCGYKPHFSRPCLALSKKINANERVVQFSKFCRSKPQTNSSKYIKQKKLCDEENNSSMEVFSEAVTGVF